MDDDKVDNSVEEILAKKEYFKVMFYNLTGDKKDNEITLEHCVTLDREGLLFTEVLAEVYENLDLQQGKRITESA